MSGADLLQGVMVGLANWPGKNLDALSQRFVERTKEPWFGHNSLFAYGHVVLLKAALEQAGVAERHKVADAIRAMNMTDGPAQYFPGGKIQFDDKGRRIGAQMVMIQWQNGKPVQVWPAATASASAIWKA